jgi:signal transduction histidine kinase
MKFRHMLGIAALALSLSATALYAQANGNAAEAKAMLEKAVGALKANKATALANFVKKDGGFQDRDLYVFCYNTSDGKFTAHVNPALMGTDIRALKEKDGSPLGDNIFKTAKEGAIATVDYKFPKPGTTEPLPKQSFVTVVGDQGCGVGYYK